MYDRNTGEVQKGDTGTSLDYTKQKDILRLDNQYSHTGDYFVLDKGILAPNWAEYGEECERYWTACWEASDPNYAAVLKGDFSAFAGSYTGDIIGGKDGVVTGNNITSQKPVSVTVREVGAVCCTVKWYEEEEPDGGVWRSFLCSAKR